MCRYEQKLVPEREGALIDRSANKRFICYEVTLLERMQHTKISKKKKTTATIKSDNGNNHARQTFSIILAFFASQGDADTFNFFCRRSSLNAPVNKSSAISRSALTLFANLLLHM